MLGEAFETTLGAAQAGADWALASLYRELQPRLLRYLSARAGRDGEDLASATWLDVARNLRSFSGDESGFRAWVFTIARRRLVDHRRSQKRRRSEPLTEEAGETGLGAFHDSSEIEALAGRLGDEAARRIVACLPEDQADIVLLRVVAGLSVEEVAKLTGRREGTVRVIQHRALKRLAKEVGEEL